MSISDSSDRGAPVATFGWERGLHWLQIYDPKRKSGNNLHVLKTWTQFSTVSWKWRKLLATMLWCLKTFRSWWPLLGLSPSFSEPLQHTLPWHTVCSSSQSSMQCWRPHAPSNLFSLTPIRIPFPRNIQGPIPFPHQYDLGASPYALVTPWTASILTLPIMYWKLLFTHLFFHQTTTSFPIKSMY